MALRSIDKLVKPHVIGDMYERWTLDVVTCLGRTCAALFQDHPLEFKRVPPGIAVSLAELRYRTGFDETYLDDQQRMALAGPILGDSDGYGQHASSSVFHRSASAVRERAKDFVLRVYTTGEREARDAFRDAATTFQLYLTTVNGNVLADANARLAKHFDVVVSILRTNEFAAGLGVPPAPQAPWPLDLSPDGNGAFLVHTVARRISGETSAPIAVSDEEFLQAQRVASYGAVTIDRILQDKRIWVDDTAADEAISLAYRWCTSLKERVASVPMLNG